MKRKVKLAVRLKPKRRRFYESVRVKWPIDFKFIGSKRFMVSQIATDPLHCSLRDLVQNTTLNIRFSIESIRDRDVVSRNEVFKKVQRALWRSLLKHKNETREVFIDLWMTLWNLRDMPQNLDFELDGDELWSATEIDSVDNDAEVSPAVANGARPPFIWNQSRRRTAT